MDYNELEALFLNSDDPIVEQIIEAEDEDQAREIASDYLMADHGPCVLEVNSDDLLRMVKKFRDQSAA